MATITIENIIYKINNNKAYICGYENSITSEVEIGTYLISDSASYKVVGIDPQAFANCEKLTKITLPNTLEKIGKFAFYNCKKLEEVILDKCINLDEIGKSAFQNCIELKEIKVPYNVKEIKAWTFARCSKLKSVELKDGITEISHQAFAYCYNITKFSIMAANVKFGHEVFYNIENHTGYNLNRTFKIPFNCKDKYVIAKASGFTIVESGDISIQNINYKLDKEKKTATVVKNKEFIGFANIPSTIYIGNDKYKVEKIAENAFNECGDLTTVAIPESITEDGIGIGAFAKCPKLNYFEVANTGNPFYNAQNGVLYNNDKTKILAYPPAHTAESFVIDSDVIEIADFAFADFQNLKRITFRGDNKVTRIIFGKNAFDSLNKRSCVIFVPKGTKDNFTEIDELEDFAKIEDSNEIIVDGINYVILSEDDKTVEVGDNTKFVGEAKIPEKVEYAGVKYTVVAIGEKAFNNNEQLTSITFPDTIKDIKSFGVGYCHNVAPIMLPTSLQSVGSYAFSYCNFQTLNIPNSVKNIARSAFSYMNISDGKISIPSSVISIEQSAFYGSSVSNFQVDTANPNYKSIDEVLFNKEGNKIIHYPSKKTDSCYTVPNNVSIIGKSCFENNGFLKTLILPPTITKLEGAALWSCPSLTQLNLSTTIPPIVEEKGLEGVKKQKCILIVPKGYVAKYKSAQGWKDFKDNIIEMGISSSFTIAGYGLGIITKGI